MEREELTDLGIIGGGPAGCAAALEARRRGLSVAIWDRDRFPRDKVCGEFLSAECLPWLEREVPAALARATAITRCEFVSARGRAHALPLSMAGRGLSRWSLDLALWQAAASAGVRAYENEPIRQVRQRKGRHIEGAAWELTSQLADGQRARAVIVACGRWWRLDGFPSPVWQARSNGAAAWLGAKAHFHGVATRDVVEMYFFRGGYCGLAPVEDGLYNACCLVHESLLGDSRGRSLADFAGWLRTLARHPALEARLRLATQASETLATAPVRPARRMAEHDGALLVGDAAGFLDPFTGDGISMAIHSGQLAAQRLAGESSGISNGRAGEYRRRLSRSVRRSYLIAGLIRRLVCAPAGVQDSAMAALVPLFGKRLLAETRWRTIS